MLLLQAMAKVEDFGKPGARPTRNNSPLDLIYGDEAIHFGAIGADGRYAKFATVEDGWNAGRRWLSIKAHFDSHGNLIGGYLGATMKQVIWRFSPPGDGANDPQAYLDSVVRDTTLPRTITETSILTADLLTIPVG
jgi:hypothetical protein